MRRRRLCGVGAGRAIDPGPHRVIDADGIALGAMALGVVGRVTRLRVAALCSGAVNVHAPAPHVAHGATEGYVCSVPAGILREVDVGGAAPEVRVVLLTGL